MKVKELIEKLIDLQSAESEVLLNHIDDTQVPISSIYVEDDIVYIDDATMTGYKLSNRYGDKNYLVPVKGNDYKIVLQHDLGLRVGYNKDNSICFVDPSGGPMLSVGDKIPELGTITRIYTDLEGILLTIK